VPTADGSRYKPAVGGPDPELYRASAALRVAYFTATAAVWNGGPQPAVVEADLREVLAEWHDATVASLEYMAHPLNGDPVLADRLRAAYAAAVQAYVRHAATDLGRDQVDIFQDYARWIPSWAVPSGFAASVPRRRAEFVEFFHQAAARWAAPGRPADTSAVDSELNDWFPRLHTDETYVKRFVTGTADRTAWTADIRQAYTAAVRALLTRAAATQHRPESDLYEENRGRIPLYAWQLPHRLEPWTDVPIPADVPAHGEQADYPVNDRVGVRVVAGVDNATFADDRTAGEATITPEYDEYAPGGPRVTLVILIRMVTRFDQVRGDDGGLVSVPHQAISGYGRGTTAADRAGGEVDRYGSSANFHEGQHAMNYMDYLRQNPPPTWPGPVIRDADPQLYDRYLPVWKTSWQIYLHRMNAYTIRHTHCVGLNSDEHNRHHPEPGYRPECGP
jgi:hypothetical protein